MAPSFIAYAQSLSRTECRDPKNIEPALVLLPSFRRFKCLKLFWKDPVHQSWLPGLIARVLEMQ